MLTKTDLGKVMDILLDPYKTQTRKAMLFLLACGSVVRETESFDSLRGVIGRYVAIPE